MPRGPRGEKRAIMSVRMTLFTLSNKTWLNVEGTLNFLESGQMQHRERRDGGAWVDTTQREIDWHKKTIGMYEGVTFLFFYHDTTHITRMTGVDVIERLRSAFPISALPPIPALLISGDASSLRCEVGSRGYRLLYKPMNAERFHAALVDAS